MLYSISECISVILIFTQAEVICGPSINGYGGIPAGCQMDKDGFLWVADMRLGLLKVDPVMKTYSQVRFITYIYCIIYEHVPKKGLLHVWSITHTMLFNYDRFQFTSCKLLSIVTLCAFVLHSISSKISNYRFASGISHLQLCRAVMIVFLTCMAIFGLQHLLEV